MSIPNWLSHLKYRRLTSRYKPTDVYLYINANGTWTLKNEPNVSTSTLLANGTWSNIVPINDNSDNSGSGYIDVSCVFGSVLGNWVSYYEYTGNSQQLNHESVLPTDFKFMLNCGISNDLFDTDVSYYFTSEKVYKTGVTIGDSIVQRYPEGNFASYLTQYTKIAWINKGIGGDQILDVIDRWATDVVALNPDIILIHVGVNDSKYELDYVEERKAHFSTLLDLCVHYHCIVMSVPYIGGAQGNAGVTAAAKLLNVFLKNECTRRGFKFFDYWIWSFVNVNAGKYGYNTDGIHPDVTGTQKISEMLYEAILTPGRKD